MDEIKIIFIAAPEFSTNVAEQLKEELPQIFEKTINDKVTWTLETVTDGFTSVAEDDEELLEGVISLLDTKEWDYAISLTDIPLFHEEEVVLARVNYDYAFGLVSLPACGWSLNKRLTDVVVQVVEDIYSKDTKISDEEQNKRINNLFKLGNIERINESEIETEDLRYVFSSRLYGMMTILLGMTYDNRPWTIMPSLKSTIAVAFGSGAYAIIFPTLWTISYEYHPWRLTIFMLLAIISMGLWIIQGHNLWEKETISDNKKYRKLYNTTTIITLFLAVASFYIILIGLFLVTIFVFVEPTYYAEQVEINHLPNFMNFLELAWLTASVGTITGAVGVGYQMTLTYKGAHDIPGKTSDDKDTFEIEFVELVLNKKIAEKAVFDTEDPEAVGEMLSTWYFEEVAEGTKVTLIIENVPPAIPKDIHMQGLNETLDNLELFIQNR